MQQLYPLQLCGVVKSPIWGGTRLLREWNKKATAATVGESWELTVRKQEIATITNGAFRGRDLASVIAEQGAAVTGVEFGEGDFPLLIKLLDANDALSVQVHPDDDYAARVEGDRGKTEMWYIVDADEGAQIICGLADGVSADDFARAVDTGNTLDALRYLSVRPGEVYFIPAGLPHAIGKGILIAEIQQNCDLTYRVYDYDRTDADGNKRELHVKKALDVIRPFTDEQIEALRYAKAPADFDKDRLLAHCPFFRVERLMLTDSSATLPAQKMSHLLCLDGNADLRCDNEYFPVKKGDSYLIPACLCGVTLSGTATLLLSSLD